MPRGQKFPLEVMLRAMREVDNGVPVSVVCRKVGMVEKTFYRYREKYAGMEATEAPRLRELEEENARLEKLLSEQMLHNEALRDVLSKKMVRPAARRQAVEYVRTAYQLGDPLLARLRALATTRPRAGYRTLGRLLRREGNRVNDKRVYRLYRSEGLSLRVKRRRRHAASARVVPQPAMRPWQRWAMDFMSDSTTDGHRFRYESRRDEPDEFLTGRASWRRPRRARSRHR